MSHFKSILLLSIVFVGISCNKEIQTKSGDNNVIQISVDEPIIQIGSETYMGSDFESALNNYLLDDSTDYTETVNDIILQKRLFLEAESKGYADDEILLEELDSYRRILAKSYIQDTSLVNNLARLTYERMKREINASHILLAIPIHAAPKDTLLYYNKLLELKEAIDSGASFDSLALVYSADINTKTKAGEMGWFSALQLIFPIENGAYQTEVGATSNPIRSKSGYHIIKVNDSRAYSGKVIVKHILKAIPENYELGFDSYQKNKIDSIYTLLMNGSDFDEICSTNSDDTYSRQSAGILNAFSIGSRQEKEFEEMAYSLAINEISKPVKTSIGWHIIKMVQHIPLEPYENIEEFIINKVNTDSRGAYIEKLGYDKYIPNLSLSKNKEALDDILALANQHIIERTWKVNKQEVTEKVLLTILNKTYSNLDFIDYAEDKQTFEKIIPGYTAELYLRWYYDDFEKSKIEEAILENFHLWNKEFETVINANKESLVVRQFMNVELFNRSISDTLAHRLFFEQHMTKYQTKKKVQATIIKANQKELIQNYYDLASGDIPYRLKRGILPIYFNKNLFLLENELKRKLSGLNLIMDRNPSYLVEIGGHIDSNENENLSALRIKEVVNYLNELGLDITRIQEFDYGSSRLNDRFDWTQNQRVSFQFFSNDKSDLVSILNSENDSISVTEGEFLFDENSIIDATEWKVGEFEANFENYFYRIEIKKIVQKRQKTFKEARGQVISDYQKEMEKQLIADLSVKYPVILEENKIKSIYDSYLQQNP